MKNKVLSIGITLFFTTSFQNIIGLFTNKNYNLSEVVNVYGESVELYGIGIYRYDSVFKAMIFKGTDFAVLFFVLPLFLFVMYKAFIKDNGFSKIILLGISAFLLYFHSSVAVGVFYNQLHILYIINFSLSLILFLLMAYEVRIMQISSSTFMLKTKALNIYLGINSLALVFAWIPEIIYTSINNTGLSFGFHYTTEATHVLDIGIIIPLIIFNIYLLHKRNNTALKLFVPLLTMSLLIGIVVVLQTIYQLSANVELTSQEIVTKVIPFVLNSIYSMFILRYFKKNVELI